MGSIFIYRYVPTGNFYSRTIAETRGEIIRGIKAKANDYRERYKIDVRVRHSNTEGVKINVKPVIIGGQHYMGEADGGQINLHNCVFPWGPEYRWGDPLALGGIVFHELRHTLGARHVDDERDLMHEFCGRDLTKSLPWFRKRFGVIKPKSLREANEIETAISGKRSGCGVGLVVRN